MPHCKCNRAPSSLCSQIPPSNPEPAGRPIPGLDVPCLSISCEDSESTMARLFAEHNYR